MQTRKSSQEDKLEVVEGEGPKRKVKPNTQGYWFENQKETQISKKKSKATLNVEHINCKQIITQNNNHERTQNRKRKKKKENTEIKTVGRINKRKKNENITKSKLYKEGKYYAS